MKATSELTPTAASWTVTQSMQTEQSSPESKTRWQYLPTFHPQDVSALGDKYIGETSGTTSMGATSAATMGQHVVQQPVMQHQQMQMMAQ